jgi:ketosteroid isomerase-like protein
MQTCLPVLGVLLLGLSGVAAEPMPIDAKAAVGKLLEEQNAAWNKGDLEGFMAGYWKSDELSFYSAGDKTTGWQATFARYKKKYQSEGKEMGTLAFSELDVHPAGEADAIARGQWKLTFKDGKTSGGLFTLWLRKLPEGWRIVHDHTSAR